MKIDEKIDENLLRFAHVIRLDDVFLFKLSIHTKNFSVCCNIDEFGNLHDY